jgi:DNA-binding LacI/PurR family transcriptional regulator
LSRRFSGKKGSKTGKAAAGDVSKGGNGGRGKVTIERIARISGYSVSTVSRAIRNDSSANKKTADRIRAVARELNYFPNLLAKGLRQRRTHTIGIIFNDLNNPFYSEILSEMTGLLNEKNFSVFICHSRYDPELERNNIVSLLSKKVDGIIISPISNRIDNVTLLRDNDIKTVFIDSPPYYRDMSYVYTDHGSGVEAACEYLIGNGHREIMLFAGPKEKLMPAPFVKGYRRSLERHGIPVRSGLLLEAEKLTIECGYETFKRLLAGGVPGKRLNFTGIIAQNDLLAIGVYRVARELGFGIPDNYSIVGYDNIEVSSALSPPLTTVHQSRKRLGSESVRILLQNIENESRAAGVVRIAPNLVIRGSVRKIN